MKGSNNLCSEMVAKSRAQTRAPLSIDTRGFLPVDMLDNLLVCSLEYSLEEHHTLDQDHLNELVCFAL